MKILWLTDLHLDLNDKLGIIENGINSRIEEKKRFLKYVVKTAIEQNVQFIVDGGDIFNPRTSSVADELREIYVENFILPLSGSNIKVRILGTNHGADGDFNAIGSESHLFANNIKLISEERREPISDTLVFWYIPYAKDVPPEAYVSPEKTVIFGHFTRKEAKFPDPNAVSLDSSKIKYAIIGHEHISSLSEDKKVFYPGASFPNNYLESRSIPIANFFIFNMSEPEITYKKYEYTEINPIQYLKTSYKNMLNLEIKEKAIVKVVLQGAKEEISKVSETFLRSKYPQAQKFTLEYEVTSQTEMIQGCAKEIAPEELIVTLNVLLRKDKFTDYGLKKLETAKGQLI